MIALFVEHERDLRDLNCYPTRDYKIVRDEEDLRGYSFTGVIIIAPYGSVSDYKKNKALELIKEYQPELFK